MVVPVISGSGARCVGGRLEDSATVTVAGNEEARERFSGKK